MATECADPVYLLCDRNGSECKCNDSVQLGKWPQWVIALNSIEHNNSSQFNRLIWKWHKTNAWHVGGYCDVSKWRGTKHTAYWMLLWRFEMAQIWNPTHNLFSRFLPLGTRTGRPRTHRTPKDSHRKRLLSQRNQKILDYKIDMIKYLLLLLLFYLIFSL